MKKPFRTLVAVCACALASTSASADFVIDITGEWQGSRSNGWDKIAQTLIVPDGKPVLNEFEIGVGADVANRTFRLRVYAWDRNVEHTIGGELFVSGPHAAPVGAVQFIKYDIGIELAPGEEYAVIVDWEQEAAGNGVAFISGSSYTDGYANFTNGDFGSAWSFSQNSGFDMAFRATFKVPAPAAMALLGVAGVLGRRRRRRA